MMFVFLKTLINGKIIIFFIMLEGCISLFKGDFKVPGVLVWSVTEGGVFSEPLSLISSL